MSKYYYVEWQGITPALMVAGVDSALDAAAMAIAYNQPDWATDDGEVTVRPQRAGKGTSYRFTIKESRKRAREMNL